MIATTKMFNEVDPQHRTIWPDSDTSITLSDHAIRRAAERLTDRPWAMRPPLHQADSYTVAHHLALMVVEAWRDGRHITKPPPDAHATPLTPIDRDMPHWTRPIEVWLRHHGVMLVLRGHEIPGDGVSLTLVTVFIPDERKDQTQ